MNTTVPDFMINRICRQKVSKYEVARSTPIPFFGQFPSATVYTIGINPSHHEFLSPAGALLHVKDKRLHDYESLGIAVDVDNFPLSEGMAVEIYKSCLNYFNKNPYKWFNPLVELTKASFSASYFDGSACHLDLVQSATNPVWSKISIQSLSQEDYLRTLDKTFLEQQIYWIRKKNPNVRALILSGRTVVESLKEVFELKLFGRTDVPNKCKQYELYVGEFDGIPAYGTSMNIPDAHTSRSHREFLAKWLKQCQMRVV